MCLPHNNPLHLTQSDSHLPADRQTPAWSATAPSGATFSASKKKEQISKCAQTAHQLAADKSLNMRRDSKAIYNMFASDLSVFMFYLSVTQGE